jgi:hypothetical protein
MKFETKVELGKKAYELVKEGTDIREAMIPIATVCALDEAATGESCDPLELFILGINEYTIDSVAETMKQAILDGQSKDHGILDNYKEAVSMLTKDLVKCGKEELVGTFLPANTLLGMALCKAGERMMRGEK